jgi:hypothetical protein
VTPDRVFACVGIGFGLLFVLLNAGDLPGGWTVVALVAAAGLALVAAWFGVVQRPPGRTLWDASRARGYWTAVLAEVVAIPVGAAVLGGPLDHPELTVLWVVFVVGAHFLPARAFGRGAWTALGLALMLLALVGAGATLAVDVVWASAAAVLAGVLLIGFPIVQRSRAAG